MRVERDPELTQEDLAIELSKIVAPAEISQQRISGIERGASMSASEMLAICEFFGIDANKFKPPNKRIE